MLAWPLLKPGGAMIFDDYLWGQERDPLDRPQMAVDAFLAIHARELVRFAGLRPRQVYVQKRAKE